MLSIYAIWRHLQRWEKHQITSTYICCLGFLSLNTYILIWSTLLPLSVIYYIQSYLVLTYIMLIYIMYIIFIYIWACHLETSTAMRKSSVDMLLYLLNSSLSHDIITFEAPFPQSSIVLCSELSVCVCICDLFNFSGYEYVCYVGLYN